jgi:CDP-diglyceride synthetase
LLALLGLAAGFAPGRVGSTLVAPAVGFVLGARQPLKLSLWHGVILALVLSLVSLVAGLIIYEE